MIPLRRTLFAILALALAATACSSGGGHVATVGETVITEGDLADLYEVDTLTIDDGLRATIFGLVAKAILTDALRDDFGEEIDSGEVDSVEQAMIDDMNRLGLTPAGYLQVEGAAPAMLRHNAEIAVLRESAQRHLAGDLVDQILADPLASTTVCASHILSILETDSQEALDRIEAGEDFAAVADEVSTDSPPGGDLDCRLANRYVEEFAVAAVEAPLNEVVGPVQTQFGYHLILVRERTVATREAIEANPQEFLARTDIEGLWEQWLNEKLAAAAVELEAKYGSWTAFGILPPSE